MKKLILTSASAVFCILLTSCFGGGVIYPREDTLHRFNLGYDKTVVKTDQGQNPTESILLKKWGEPSSRKAKNDFTVWRYYNGVNFAGVIPMVVIGVPIAIPVSPRYVDFYMKSGKAEKVSYSSTEFLSAYYGPENEATAEMKFHVRRE
jgi:hypothetical protein